MSHKIKVTFISIWEEGETKTKANLDLDTGIVSEIEFLNSDDDGSEYGGLAREEIRLGDFSARVEQCPNNDYILNSLDDLVQIKEMHKGKIS